MQNSDYEANDMSSTVKFDFSGQTAVVSGGTRGIGAAVSRALLENGARVVATHSGNSSRAQEFRNSLGDAADRLETDGFDVADYAACEAFFHRFDDAHDQLDILVCNAGIRRDAVVGMMAEEDWRRVLDVNLSGSFNLCKPAVHRMMSRRYGVKWHGRRYD
ncbi:MAG: SDR family NAD(P)-dependent oxidoreductase, partial [bacterium]